MLQTIGYNEKMDLAHEPNTSNRENYFVFTLAAYIVKFFAGLPEYDIRLQFGEGVEIAYKIANEIVDAYVYQY